MPSTDCLLDDAVDAARVANVAAAAQSAAMLAFVRARRSDAVAAGESMAGAEDASQVAVEELAVALEAGSSWVQQRVHVAATLADDLPIVAAEHASGALDEAKARAIASAAWRLRRTSSFAVLDARAPAYAAGHTLVQLRQWLRTLVVRLEPDLAAERRRRAQAERGVWFTHDDDAMATLFARIKAADALLLERELTIAAKHARAADDDRTLDQIRADLLVDRLLGRAGDDSTGRGRFHVGVTVPLDSLLGLSSEPGASVDGRLTLDVELLRELATAPGTLLSRILTDPAGGILDAVELGRFPTAQLERALVLLDGVCAFPTCNAAAVTCDTDHVTAHPRGPTSAANLWHLCRRHHQLKTRRRLTTTVGTDGRHRWQLPTGLALSRTHQRRTFTATSSLEGRLAGLIEIEYVPAA